MDLLAVEVAVLACVLLAWVMLRRSTHRASRRENQSDGRAVRTIITATAAEEPSTQATASPEPGQPAVAVRPKRTRTREVAVTTPLGTIAVDNRRNHPVAVIALGQAEDHLRWYYDVYRKRVLQGAVRKLRAYERGDKDASNWSDSYFDFLQRAPSLLLGIAEERDMALSENRSSIENNTVRVLGTYRTREEAELAATYSRKKREPTLNAGWLNVHVVAIPQPVSNQKTTRAAASGATEPDM